ncbi:TadE/TadG family type IV pilus assembly protein [Heliorestis convoluta]|uniref:TadE family pillus assembly protein n=1 Tax=Heliorestis convoluta TaxID=356322 RepID=A0A5Q2N193_9FIRM|nr:TadE family protein [Heliorestis convoluta]QGG48567.1 tadE family pillus assembly protein [Heliorestis convoluta]
MSVKKVWSNHNKGQGLIEFALILPIFIMFFFSIIDLGRLMYYHTMVDNATRVTMRMISVGISEEEIANNLSSITAPLTGTTTVISSTSTDDQGDLCTQFTLTPASGHVMIVTVTPPYDTSLTIGEQIGVSIHYKMDFLTPISTIFGATADINATYIGRVESPPP